MFTGRSPVGVKMASPTVCEVIGAIASPHTPAYPHVDPLAGFDVGLGSAGLCQADRHGRAVESHRFRPVGDDRADERAARSAGSERRRRGAGGAPRRHCQWRLPVDVAFAAPDEIAPGAPFRRASATIVSRDAGDRRPGTGRGSGCSHGSIGPPHHRAGSFRQNDGSGIGAGELDPRQDRSSRAGAPRSGAAAAEEPADDRW